MTSVTADTEGKAEGADGPSDSTATGLGSNRSRYARLFLYSSHENYDFERRQAPFSKQTTHCFAFYLVDCN